MPRAYREGLLLMARAGYDPRMGVRFWQRFNSTPEAVLLYSRAEKQRGKGKRLRK